MIRKSNSEDTVEGKPQARLKAATPAEPDLRNMSELTEHRAATSTASPAARPRFSIMSQDDMAKNIVRAALAKLSALNNNEANGGNAMTKPGPCSEDQIAELALWLIERARQTEHDLRFLLSDDCE